MHAISSYRSNRPINKQTITQTGAITIHCTAASLARSVITGFPNPGLFQDFPGPPWKIFQDLFRARECLNIKNGIYNIQSVVHCRKFSMKQNVLHYCCLFSIWTTRKKRDFQGYFPGLSRTLSFNFQDFPRLKWFSRTFQVLEFSRKKSRTFQEAWEPCNNHVASDTSSWSRKICLITQRLKGSCCTSVCR